MSDELIDRINIRLGAAKLAKEDRALLSDVGAFLDRLRPAKPAKIGETELVESVAFQGGSLCVEVNGKGDEDGGGFLVLAAEDLEPDTNDDGYRVARVRPIDFLAMRDFLNRVFPVPADPQVLSDMETLLQDVSATGEWRDEHEEILDRWRGLRGEEGKTGWRWWWKEPGDDLYCTDHATRDEALAAALMEEPGATEVELIEARNWSDDINVETTLFAESRNYERVRVANND